MLAMAGHALAYVAGEVEEGAALITRAISLDPNLVTARHWSGFTQLWLGDVETAIEQFQSRAAFESAGSMDLQYPDRAGQCLFSCWPQRGGLIVGDGRCQTTTQVCARTTHSGGMSGDVWTG